MPRFTAAARDSTTSTASAAITLTIGVVTPEVWKDLDDAIHQLPMRARLGISKGACSAESVGVNVTPVPGVDMREVVRSIASESYDKSRLKVQRRRALIIASVAAATSIIVALFLV